MYLTHWFRFIAAYEAAVALTLPLCNAVMANCFVNASYDPAARNGSCPDQVGQFYVGYAWEDGGGGRVPNCPRAHVPYPFPVYTQTPAFHYDAAFAANTTLNFII